MRLDVKKSCRLVVGPAAALAAVLWSACTAEEWTGFVYPDRNELRVHEEIGRHRTLADCRDAARRHIASSGYTDADYECGLNCRPMFPSLADSVEVCDRTER